MFQQGHTAAKATQSWPFDDPENWVLIFEDEFDQPTLDTSKWVTCYWWATDGCTIASNNELEWYQPNNVSINNGALQLTAREELITNTNGLLFDYTSGMVTTGKNTSDDNVPHKFIFQYGYTEIKANVPAGKGLWPAFWLLPADHISRPEIDVMEIIGGEPNTNYMNFHYVDENGDRDSAGSHWDGPDFTAGWHTFGVDWRPDAIIWYVDGVERWRFDDARYVPNEPMYLLLNLAVGGDWPGAPDQFTTFPSSYEIDYVRVWRPKNRMLPLSLVADSYVDSEQPGDNFGETEILSTDGDPIKTVLLRFDPRQLAVQTVGAVTLQLHTGPNAGHESSQTIDVMLLKSFEWEETNVTFLDFQTTDWVKVGEFEAPFIDTTYEIELDSALMNEVMNQQFTLALVHEGDNGLHILSKENRLFIPQLLVQPLDTTAYIPLIPRVQP